MEQPTIRQLKDVLAVEAYKPNLIGVAAIAPKPESEIQHRAEIQPTGVASFLAPDFDAIGEFYFRKK